jgi:hypothetical protein
MYRTSFSAALLLFAVSACGAGASNPPANTMPVIASTSPSSAGALNSAAATLTVVIPLAGASALQQGRSALYVAPSTANIYISLQDSAGHGNPIFSVAEQVNSQNCTTTATAKTCTFTVPLPIGADTLSILTSGSDNVPLAYSNFPATVNADGSVHVAPGALNLGGIIAKAIATYNFGPISSNAANAPRPTLDVVASDAAGNQLSLLLGSDAPFGDTVGAFTVSQNIGQFVVYTDLSGFPGAISPAESTASSSVTRREIYFVETGNGTSNTFTTAITTATAQTQYTKTEFPPLPFATVTVPASSTTLTLTCQFASATPATNPCQASVPVTLPIQ